MLVPEIMGKSPVTAQGENTLCGSYQEVKSQFGFLEAVDELGLARGSRSQRQHALCHEEVERKTRALEHPFPGT